MSGDQPAGPDGLPVGVHPDTVASSPQAMALSFLASLFVELDVPATARVLLGKVCQRARTGDQQDVVGDAERPRPVRSGPACEPPRRLLDDGDGSARG